MLALAAGTQKLKAKLTEKSKTRPSRMVRKKMPDGIGELERLPNRRELGRVMTPEAADAEYINAMDKVSAAFGAQLRSQTTGDEHKAYMRILERYLVRTGFGSYVEVIVDKTAGLGYVLRARRDASGAIKMLPPQIFVGYLLEMAVGSKEVPKGGHVDDVRVAVITELSSACGQRDTWRRREGKFGHGELCLRLPADCA